LSERARLEVPQAVLHDTFAEFRRCGKGRRECQVLWTAPWARTHQITALVHPIHREHGAGFELDGNWLTLFWQELVRLNSGIRVQVHTHPRGAFHSAIDDAYPIIHTPGFLSLVIPYFGMRASDLSGAYLTEMTEVGRWQEMSLSDRIVIV
jgi:hypothetical protein